MIELNFLTLDDLDHPVYKVKNNVLFDRQPFFTDYYIVIFLKKNIFPQPCFKPIIINDRELVINYGGQNLSTLVVQVIFSSIQIHSSTFKIKYHILVLNNSWWCIYIEKRSNWDCFQSIGVITIMSHDKNAVLTYFQEHFVPKLIKNAKFKKS